MVEKVRAGRRVVKELVRVTGDPPGATAVAVTA
jgi:hypothetical protein